MFTWRCSGVGRKCVQTHIELFYALVIHLFPFTSKVKPFEL
ncbi:hypothetical protein VCHC46B1_1840 [Vibrio cholerae HC-46B1]|nr:hypothetical protein VCHE48_0663 [Vibrio cholerae HE48]EJH60892.1 hypothetical protein VCHE45_2981 [Vibrio cholerae HE-45]EKG88695.1 hypothetical protein VCHE16_1087 [Vibrio paracholerae HE-16]EKL03230.1 hypothetical protein VCHC41B1_1605 [Vibrio cholerae HC-41B1]EKL96899.1 hypothetical protein VCHC46B1_1840 [Vibrio cholerae HC-46B1]EKM03919.1 hypothetical protein VCHC44C1_1695 [Vibrio cholerae HC-44C1]EMP87388.1 hypothetical protein VC116063_001342 [Vibrio cholerae O1 str. 116063]CFW1224